MFIFLQILFRHPDMELLCVEISNADAGLTLSFSIRHPLLSLSPPFPRFLSSPFTRFPSTFHPKRNETEQKLSDFAFKV